MNPRHVARVHTDGTWVYSRHTEKRSLEHLSQPRTGEQGWTDLYFLLTTSHAARLAARIFRSSSLSGVCRSGEGRCEIKRISCGRGLLGRVIGRKVVS